MRLLKTIRGNLRALCTSATFLIYSGSMARAGFAFLLGVLIARMFGTEGFGLFHAYTVLMSLTLCIVGEALDHGLIRHYTDRLNHEAERAGDVLGSALALRFGIAVVVALAGFAVIAALPATMAEADLSALAVPGLLAGVLSSVVTYVAAIYLSEGRFLARAAILPALTLCRFVVLGTASMLGLVAINSLIWLDTAVFFACATVAMALVWRRLAAAWASRATIALLGRFSLSSITLTVPFVAYMGLGSPLLVYFHGASEASLFGVAASLAVLIEHATAALVSVSQREVSAIREASALRAFLRKATRRGLLVMLAVSPFAVLGGHLIPLAFGADFAPAQAFFPIIILGALCYMATTPRALVFFALDQPGRLSIGAGIGFAVWLVAALVLIPAQGAMGAALALLAARAGQAIALTAMVAVAPLDSVGRRSSPKRPL